MHQLRCMRGDMSRKRDFAGRYAVSDRSGRACHQFRRGGRRMPCRRDQAGRVRKKLRRASVGLRAGFLFSAGIKQNNGDIAHLVERLNGIQEVDGSSPFISTKRDVYAHSAYVSELETALSVSFSFSGIFWAFSPSSPCPLG